MYCGVCGSQVPDGAAHCPNCGSKIAAKAVQQPVAQEPISAPKIQMDPIPAPNIPTDPIPAPNIPVESIAANVTSEPFVPAAEDVEDAAGAAAQEAAARAAQEAAARVAQERAAQEAAARAAQEAAAKAAQEAAAKAAQERAAQEAAAKAAAEEAQRLEAQRAAEEAAAREQAAREQAALEKAAAEAAAQQAAAKAAAAEAQKAAAEAAAKAAADRAAQQAAAAAAVQAAQKAAAPQAPATPQATPQATAAPQAAQPQGKTSLPQYQMINGHYVLVPQQLQQIQQTQQAQPGVPVPPVAPGAAPTKSQPDAASVLSVIALICAILAIGGSIWTFFRNLGDDKFIVYNLLSTISMELYILIGICVFTATKKVKRDYAAPSMAVSYTLISMPLLIDLMTRPTSYLRYIPDTFEKWATRLTPIFLIIGLLLIIACASTMFAPKLNAANYAQKALNAKFLSGFCGLVTLAAALSVGYYALWDGTLHPLFKNFDRYSKIDYWWLSFGTATFYYLAMIFGWLAVIAAGFTYRKKLTSR